MMGDYLESSQVILRAHSQNCAQETIAEERAGLTICKVPYSL